MKTLLITGGSGFLGRALVAEFKRHLGIFDHIETFRSSEYDLTKQQAVKDLLADKKPHTIIHLAARVGGIGANMREPGRFFYENLIMGVDLIELSRLFGVKKFVGIATICSYPKFTPVPFKEDDLWNGYPEETNAPYGLAKKMMLVQLNAYRQQYGFNGITLFPVNLYGPGDNFDPESSHVIPAMMRKFHEAKLSGAPSVTLWGDGSATREFLYVEDCARGIRLATEKYNKPDPVNIGSGKEISIKDLAVTVKNLVGFTGAIIWDLTKPNGQPRRCLDVTRARNEFGFEAITSFSDGLRRSYDWYMTEYPRDLPIG